MSHHNKLTENLNAMWHIKKVREYLNCYNEFVTKKNEILGFQVIGEEYLCK